jgi:hypothetical protein
VAQRLPRLAAVSGAQHQAERTDDISGARILEPDVEERVLSARGREALGFANPLLVAAALIV